VHAGEEDHARPGWTTSRRGQDSPWKSQSERQRTEINGESTSTVWSTLGSRTAKEQNRTTTTKRQLNYHCAAVKAAEECFRNITMQTSKQSVKLTWICTELIELIPVYKQSASR